MHRDLIVTGASAGGSKHCTNLLAPLPSDLPGAILVVLHTSGRSGSLLPQILGRATPLKTSHPEDGTRIQHGHVYIAPPDFHMIVQGSHIRVLQGPRENLNRPAIDPLFRSAAVSAGRRVIAAVLTGMLDDGTSGLMVVKAHGGDRSGPGDCDVFRHARNALDQVPDARVLPIETVGPELVRLVREEIPDDTEPAVHLGSLEEKETRLLELEMPQLENDERPGRPSAFACPDCGGVLWELEENGFLRFRCRVGHAFTARHLSVEQQHAIETALWSALRALEESGALYKRLADRATQGQQQQSARTFQDRAENTEQNARVLREFLVQAHQGAEQAAD